MVDVETPSAAAALSPDGAILAVVGIEGNRIFLWDRRAKKIRRVLDGPPEAINGLVFACQGKVLISFANDGSARFWDPIFGEEIV